MKTVPGGLSFGGHGLAGDHLEPALAPRALGGGVDVAAVQIGDQRQVRSGQLGLVARATVDEAGLLIAEFVLQGRPAGAGRRGGGVQPALLRDPDERSAQWTPEGPAHLHPPHQGWDKVRSWTRISGRW